MNSGYQGKASQPAGSHLKNSLPDGLDGLIFDLDGTLWDSTETVARAWNRVLEKLGDQRPHFDGQAVAGIMGKTYAEIHQALFPDLDEAQWERMALACYAEEEALIHREGGRLYPGVEAGLSGLAERFPLFIVSNCQSGYIESFLKWSGLAGLFTDFECHGNTGQSKSSNIQAVMRRNRLKLPVYLGDTQSDRNAASEAGIAFVFAACGFGGQNGHAAAVDSFSDFTHMVLNR